MRKMVEFQLHENLAKKTKIIDLPLSVVLLEDEKNYPWLFLVPRRPNITKIMDLSSEDQILLLREMDAAQRIIQETFHPTQINVAAIGNKTAQLHVHVIGFPMILPGPKLYGTILSARPILRKKKSIWSTPFKNNF